MTVHEATIAKIQQLPETLAQEVQDFVDFLLSRDDVMRWQAVQHLSEAKSLTETDMADYLPGLEAYEELLAHGQIKW